MERWGFAAAVRFVVVLVGSFRPLTHSISTTPQPTSYLLSPFWPFPAPINALQGYSLPKQQPKQKRNQFSKTMCGLCKFLKWQPVLRRVSFILCACFRVAANCIDLFSFYRWRNRYKTEPAFQRFEENESVHPGLGPPSRIFAMKYFNENGQWPQPQSQKRRTCLEVDFVFHLWAPIRERPKRHIHFLKMLKANLLKIEINTKIRRRWTLFFLIRETLVSLLLI